MGRSGSNYLSDLLFNHPSITSMRELFAPHRIHAYCGMDQDGLKKEILEIARRRHDIKCASHNDEKLSQWARRRPKQLLNAISSCKKTPLYSYKIFHGHLTVDQFKNAIVQNRSQLVIFWKRDYLDAYVSRKKARLKSSFVKSDSTSTSITLNADDFHDYYKMQSEHFDQCRQLCHDNVLTLRYEDVMQFPDEQSRLLHICLTLRHAGVDLPAIPQSQHVKVATFIQDQSPSIDKKIGNWTQFQKDCFALGLDKRASMHLK